MKTARFTALALTLLLFACLPKTPEIPMTIVPADTVLHALELRHEAFSGLKAIATVTIAKGGRTRTFDTVGVVVKDQQGFRIEAYGPLGQSLTAVVWNGNRVLLRMPGEDRIVETGPEGLERLLGTGVDPAELCAILSGNLPYYATTREAVLSCAEQGGFCILEIHQGDRLIRARISGFSAADGEREPRPLSYEVVRSGKLLYRVQFGDAGEISRYRLPLRVVVIKPADNLQLTFLYNENEVEVNVPIGEEAFSLTEDDGAESK